MSTYVWCFSVALVRILECVWFVKFIITLVYIYLKHIHGNSYDTPVSVLLLNMIFLVSSLFITKLVLCICSVSHTKFLGIHTRARVYAYIHIYSHARTCMHIYIRIQNVLLLPITCNRTVMRTLTWILVSPSSCPSRKMGMHR